MHFLLCFFIFNSCFLFAADQIHDLKKQLYPLLGTDAYDERMEVLSLLLEHPELSEQSKVPFERELVLTYMAKNKEEQVISDKGKEVEELCYQVVSDLLAHPAEEILAIVEECSKECISYSKAIKDDYDHIHNVIRYLKDKDGFPPIVLIYWLDKIAKHCDEPDVDYVKNTLQRYYKMIYTNVKQQLPKWTLFLQQRQNFRLGKDVMSPHKFIQVYADDKWIKDMQKRAIKLSPVFFASAQNDDLTSMNVLAYKFEKEDMPCSAMYWYDRIAQIDNTWTGDAAQSKLKTMYKKLLR